MKSLIVRINQDERIMIKCEYIIPNAGQIFAMNDKNEIVAVFQEGAFEAMWLSGGNEG